MTAWTACKHCGVTHAPPCLCTICKLPIEDGQAVEAQFGSAWHFACLPIEQQTLIRENIDRAKETLQTVNDIANLPDFDLAEFVAINLEELLKPLQDHARVHPPGEIKTLDHLQQRIEELLNEAAPECVYEPVALLLFIADRMLRKSLKKGRQLQ